MIQSAYKVEIAPTNQQLTLFKKAAGIARFAYNWGFADKQYRYHNLEGDDKYTSAIQQHREINQLKKTDFRWMYEVSKCVPQEALRDLEQAYKHFFKGTHSFPKFKKKGKSKDSFRLTGTIKIHPKGKHKSCQLKKIDKSHICNFSCKVKHSVARIQLPTFGTIKLKEKPNFKKSTRILSATVSRTAHKWFVALTVEEELEPVVKIRKEIVSLDCGLLDLAILSTGEKVANPKALSSRLRTLRKQSKALSRKKFLSKNWFKAKEKVSRLHFKIANIRKDTLHKLTTWLAEEYEVIVMEDLNVKGMIKNPKLSRAIADVGWGELKRQLEYKTKLAGTTLILAPRFFPSSKLCSRCWTKKKELKLSDRVYHCESCGLVLDRDENAALNLEIYGKMYKLDPSVADSWSETLNACGEGVRPFDAFLNLINFKKEQMIKAISVKQEEVKLSSLT